MSPPEVAATVDVGPADDVMLGLDEATDADVLGELKEGGGYTRLLPRSALRRLAIGAVIGTVVGLAPTTRRRTATSATSSSASSRADQYSAGTAFRGGSNGLRMDVHHGLFVTSPDMAADTVAR